MHNNYFYNDDDQRFLVFQGTIPNCFCRGWYIDELGKRGFSKGGRCNEELSRREIGISVDSE